MRKRSSLGYVLSASWRSAEGLPVGPRPSLKEMALGKWGARAMDSRQRTLALTLCIAALGYIFSSPPSLLAPPPPRGYWEIPGETVQLTALVIQEPWQGVSKPPSVSSQSKFHWIGHYPGFAAEKDKANRKKKEIREGSTSLPLGLTPNRPLLQTASSSV